MRRDDLIITLPFPLSANRIWRSFARGKRVATIKTKEYRDWLDDARPIAEAAMIVQGAEVLTGPLAVTLSVRQPDRRKRDIDNMNKSVLDCLEGIAFENDNQIEDLRTYWDGSDGPARCVVRLRPLGRAA